MTQQLSTPRAADAARVPPVRTVLSLHGADPTTGAAATWHVVPLSEDGSPGTYLVEHADGDISNPAVWMQAQRDASVVGEAEVVDLVRRMLFTA